MPKIDARERLTDFLTRGRDQPEQKTRVTCREQAEMYYAYLNLGREPGLEFFREEAETDMEIMMSLEGRRSDDIVEMMKHIEELESRDAGLQPVTEYLKDKK